MPKLQRMSDDQEVRTWTFGPKMDVKRPTLSGFEQWLRQTQSTANSLNEHMVRYIESLNPDRQISVSRNGYQVGPYEFSWAPDLGCSYEHISEQTEGRLISAQEMLEAIENAKDIVLAERYSPEPYTKPDDR